MRVLIKQDFELLTVAQDQPTHPHTHSLVLARFSLVQCVTRRTTIEYYIYPAPQRRRRVRRPRARWKWTDRATGSELPHSPSDMYVDSIVSTQSVEKWTSRNRNSTSSSRRRRTTLERRKGWRALTINKCVQLLEKKEYSLCIALLVPPASFSNHPISSLGRTEESALNWCKQKPGMDTRQKSNRRMRWQRYLLRLESEWKKCRGRRRKLVTWYPSNCKSSRGINQTVSYHTHVRIMLQSRVVVAAHQRRRTRKGPWNYGNI